MRNAVLEYPLYEFHTTLVVKAGLGDPTHGTFVGDDFHFIADSGWSHLDDHGELNPGEKMSSATIRKIKAADLHW
jgi:hypothetical protein